MNRINLVWEERREYWDEANKRFFEAAGDLARSADQNLFRRLGLCFGFGIRCRFGRSHCGSLADPTRDLSRFSQYRLGLILGEDAFADQDADQHRGVISQQAGYGNQDGHEPCHPGEFADCHSWTGWNVGRAPLGNWTGEGLTFAGWE